jgi:hypothetical protein
MLNEGLIVNDTAALVKSEMVNQIRRMGPTTPKDLERTVFEALTGHRHDEVDWDDEGNKAGYFTWLKSFDKLLDELVEDGYIRVEEEDEKRQIVPTEADPPVDYSHLVYPNQK